VLSDVDLLLGGALVHLILGLRYLFNQLNPCLCLTTWRYPTLLVLLDPAHLIVLSTVRALPLLGLHLMIVTLITNLIFAIAGIKLLLDVFEISPANVADVVPSNAVALGHEFVAHIVVRVRVVLGASGTVCAFLAAGADALSFLLG